MKATADRHGSTAPDPARDADLLSPPFCESGLSRAWDSGNTDEDSCIGVFSLEEGFSFSISNGIQQSRIQNRL
ncbi:hypothetical protein MAP00_000431 [Monascus purpureus]|nr:hypothetical protein MAP00_000431 [Monascus purpureus]